MKLRKYIQLLSAIVAGTVMPTGCHHVDNKRTPPAAVWISFANQAVWDTYGVPGALSYRYFIQSLRQPANFPYTATMKTGYGGVLLVSDINGMPRAYDLSCPVENKPDIRVAIDMETTDAVCPKCGSHYDVFVNYGSPTSGPAAKSGFGLTRYMVGNGPNGEYRVISR